MDSGFTTKESNGWRFDETIMAGVLTVFRLDGGCLALVGAGAARLGPIGSGGGRKVFRTPVEARAHTLLDDSCAGTGPAIWSVLSASPFRGRLERGGERKARTRGVRRRPGVAPGTSRRKDPRPYFAVEPRRRRIRPWIHRSRRLSRPENEAAVLYSPRPGRAGGLARRRRHRSRSEVPKARFWRPDALRTSRARRASPSRASPPRGIPLRVDRCPTPLLTRKPTTTTGTPAPVPEPSIVLNDLPRSPEMRITRSPRPPA